MNDVISERWIRFTQTAFICFGQNVFNWHVLPFTFHYGPLW